ncbi:DUF5691 domain-containing protein [Neolewinella maritima]|uniref:DUF5691 domain-containing protein n=1 Tax=Neolewinella maritima TaxID=1383882 RepID=UPI001EE8A67E|nr:DUF5691 domain-containing protein [Neolewinella maritima]
MPAPPQYTDLLRALTLGTARRELAPQIGEWLDSLAAIDPTADQAEQLLAALGLTERLHRLQPRPTGATKTPHPTPAAETRTPPSPRLARGLQLILEGTYPDLLDEAIDLVLARQTYVPSTLLPALHPRAAALLNDDYPRAQRYLEASGERGKWLAGQHPDWALLLPDYDYAPAYHHETQPARKASILANWRRVDPAAAREALAGTWPGQNARNQEVLLAGLRVGLSAADWSWLRDALTPKRKGVRRAVTELLLLAREPTALADFALLASVIVTERGALNLSLPTDELKDLFATYGGTKAPEALPHRLLRILPPRSWSELTALPLPAFWLGRTPLELRDAARAIVSFRDPDTVREFARFLVLEQPAGFPTEVGGEVIRLLPRADFDALYEELLSKFPNALQLRSLPRLLALSRDTPWSERLSKAMLLQLIDGLHSRQLDYSAQRELAQQWKWAIPLVDTAIFPWLRQQLHATTERYDAFGKLATEMLQTTAFRRELQRE